MNSEFAFRNTFKRFKNDCYIVEMDLNTDCINKSSSCSQCLGTGHVIKKIYKAGIMLDMMNPSRKLVDTNKPEKDIRKYNDGRIAYFLKDCSFDLSPNIQRLVLNIVNGKIESIFSVEFLEAVCTNNNVIYYVGSVARNNINSADRINTLKSIVEKRGL